jgi:hypothetical protein
MMNKSRFLILGPALNERDDLPKRTDNCVEGRLKKKLRSVSPREELYLPSDSRLSVKLALTFADIGCHVVSVTDPHGSILGFLDLSR